MVKTISVRFGLFLLGVGLFVAGTLHNSMKSCEDHSSSSSSTKNTETSDDIGCQKKLDELDKTWDLRRSSRQIAIKDLTSVRNKKQTYDYWEPEAVCMDDERFGGERYNSFGDGPKFVCGVDRIVEKAQKKDCLIYNVGSNNQIDFEEAVSNVMGKGNCEIHTFDPTVVPDKYVGKSHSEFHDWGFGQDGKNTVIDHKRGHFEFTEMSLVNAMKKLGHYQNRTIDIFKIDCEGCEYTALTQGFEAIARGEIKIDQIQVELHGSNRFPQAKALFEAADKANMRLFHKERNHWGCDGYTCLEYAFASSDFLRKANAHYVC